MKETLEWNGYYHFSAVVYSVSLLFYLASLITSLDHVAVEL